MQIFLVDDGALVIDGLRVGLGSGQAAIQTLQKIGLTLAHTKGTP